MAPRLIKALGAGLAVVLVAAGCGGDGGGGDEKESSGLTGVVLGTTDKPTSTDPAGAYDLPSWTIIYNVYQNLLKIPTTSVKPVGDAAEKCDFTDPTTYVCTLRDGLTFSNGDPLTSADVKFSFDRVVKINDPAGPSSLFANMKSIDATDPKTVTMHLDHADATWPSVLTTGAGAIVPSKVFPPDKKLDNSAAIGSGPYKISKYTDGQQVVFAPNEKYSGDDQLKNNSFILQYFDQASALKLAVEQGDVDVAYRGLAPSDLEALKSSNGVKVVEGNSTEIRYMVFQAGSAPFNNKAVRQAVAQVIDREAIAKNAYDGQVTPLYSMIPEGLDYRTDIFKEKFGAPDKAKAKAILDAAGVTTPVNATIWWTPSHYGPNAADEYAEVKRQLEESGLFKVELKSTEWQQYQTAFKGGQYPAWQLGWFPDFPDPDNYSAPFLDGKGGYYKNGYLNPKLTDLVATEQGSTDATKRGDAFAQIQQITAEDVPMVPIWQGKQLAAVRDGVTGVEDTFDPSFTFRFWLVGKSS
ncbi:ABC transporter substrate-binding protein [Actinoplanes sp. TBRC 11911]|uniref:ABC transporter substrate-binding protein n=1 Tax=Actinoplanes sp. TBRC 11911 TaxID=2729386 RepID=UPI00145EE71E|nr:ABC transporter substrate-binding protein [Actinoplanes sp. TBRC 11911]NMO52466.1 ABC transporter substrate-binding protein [Actinoplanes sp. TBRC 11911]